MAKRLEERRKKEKGMPGEGGIKAGSTPSEQGARHTGVPDKDPATSLLESAGKYHIQKDPGADHSESEDFATCQRPDGSRYGTSGQCRKGKETSAKAEEKKAKTSPPVNREAADRFKRERQELMEKLKAHRAKMDVMSDADQKEMKRMGNEMTRYDMLIDKALGGTQWKRYEKGTGETLDIGGGSAPIAPVPPKSAMTKKDPVASVLRSQEELRQFNKAENARLAELIKAGKVKGVTQADLERIKKERNK
jgi:hypothetical protein